MAVQYGSGEYSLVEFIVGEPRFHVIHSVALDINDTTRIPYDKVLTAKLELPKKNSASKVNGFSLKVIISGGTFQENRHSPRKM